MVQPVGTTGAEYRIWGYTKQQWMVFLILAIVNLLAGLVYSIPSPFYPQEAESKGAKATEYGFVLGVYELANFIFAPIFGANMNRIGCTRAFHAGVILMGIMTIAFGFLHFVEGNLLFIVLSFLIRIPQAIGGAAIITASVTLVTLQFSDSVATTFATIETFFGFGFCVGPTIGAFLYQAGGESFGFPLPFVVLGTVLLISSPIAIYTLWGHETNPRDPELEYSMSLVDSKSGLVSLLKIPSIDLYLYAVVTTAIGMGFLSALLEPHLRQFNLSTIVTGLMFLLYGGVYALTAPIWGLLCDKVARPKFITLTGGITIFLAFICVGPAPFLPIEPLFWLTAVGLVLFGLGLGAIFVSSFLLSLQDAREAGFPNNLSTYALVSGVWRSAVALGSFLGPSLAGVLYDLWGFRYESLVVLVLEAILIIMVLVFIVRKKKIHRVISYEDEQTKVDERTPILPISNPSPTTVRGIN